MFDFCGEKKFWYSDACVQITALISIDGNTDTNTGTLGNNFKLQNTNTYNTVN